jgi:hypothetical protein
MNHLVKLIRYKSHAMKIWNLAIRIKLIVSHRVASNVPESCVENNKIERDQIPLK